MNNDLERRIQYTCNVMDLLGRAQDGTNFARMLKKEETEQLERYFDRGYSARECAERIAADREERGDVRVTQASRFDFATVAVAGSKQSLYATISQIRDRAKCPSCGKTTVVMNVARRGVKKERITAESHCACPGGPAAGIQPRTQQTTTTAGV